MRLSFHDLTKEEQLSVLRKILASNVVEINNATGCYELKKYLNSRGYGTINIYGGEQIKSLKIHRVILEFFSDSKIPDGLVVMHECDNTKCINIKHLRLGTPQENMQDMVKKGRSSTVKGQPRRKLSEGQVLEIKRLLANKISLSQISRIYSIHISTVSDIKNGKKWKCVQLPFDDQVEA
jgi:hypothetical protein